MNQTMLKLSIFSALAFVGCSSDDGGGDSERSAIQLRLLGDVDTIRDRVSSLELVRNHDVEYDLDNTRINLDWMNGQLR